MLYLIVCFSSTYEFRVFSASSMNGSLMRLEGNFVMFIVNVLWMMWMLILWVFLFCGMFMWSFMDVIGCLRNLMEWLISFRIFVRDTFGVFWIIVCVLIREGCVFVRSCSGGGGLVLMNFCVGNLYLVLSVILYVFRYRRKFSFAMSRFSGL